MDYAKNGGQAMTDEKKPDFTNRTKREELMECIAQIDEQRRLRMERERELRIRDLRYTMLAKVMHAIDGESLSWNNHEDAALSGLVSDLRNLIYEHMKQLQEEKYKDKP